MKYIQEWHEYIEREPNKHCKKIKQLKNLIENILKKPNVIYDNTDVEAFEKFCLMLKHTEGRWAGSPLELNNTQKYYAACIFGIKIKTDDGLVRYFTESILVVARKWGKSTFISAVALYMLTMDREPGAQVWALATVKSQAEIVYNSAVKMALASPMLSKYVRTRKVSDGQKLEFPATNSFMKAGSKDTRTKDGLNPAATIIDELHAIKDRNTYDVMKSASGARLQPLMCIITTSGFERDNIFDSTYQKCADILEGKVDDNNIFPMLFEIDEEDDWEDESVWIKANPGLGVTPSLRYLQQQYKGVIQEPDQLPSFLAKHLNRASNASIIYFNALEVDSCAIEMNPSMYTDLYAVGGVDLSTTTDLTCASALIPKDGKLYLIQKYFIAESRLEQNSKEDNKAYQTFTNTGASDEINKELLHVCKGSFVRKEDVTQWFCQLRDQYGLTFLRIGYDAWSSKEWVVDMEQNGFCRAEKRDEEIIGITWAVIQGCKTLSAPMKRTKVIFGDKLLQYSRHNGLFRWCCNNTAARVDVNNNIQPDKAKSRQRIDGYVSYLIAYVAYETCKEIFDEYQS